MSSARCGPTRTWSPNATGSPRCSGHDPDKTVAFVAEMDMDAPDTDPAPR